ncbi:MAG: alpha/beta hydrolase [Chloroflexi bacterium HGW-Chloroflexi-3]|nr:MAG: alpha/beta hydrolase [Chloroflexi bacterium HGW-Chloroflexi-3]
MKTKNLLKYIVFFDLVILTSLAAFFLLNPEKQQIDGNVRINTPGDFVELSEGFVHYELSGAPGGELVVLVHGFSVPYYVWDPTVDELVKQGYRVLRYDLYGRGYSDRPKAEYNLDFFIQQLSELTTVLIPGESFHIIGLSMGGPIVASFANQYPDLIKSITLIAPEVLPVSEEDIFPMNLPLLGEWIVGVYLVPFHLPQSQLDDFYQPQDFPGWEEKYREQLQYNGFKNAILSTIRNLVKFNPLDVYETLNKSGLPILLIWGKEDQSVSYEAIVELMERLPNVESIIIDETGHLPHYEKAEIVNPMIIQFLQKIP